MEQTEGEKQTGYAKCLVRNKCQLNRSVFDILSACRSPISFELEIFHMDLSESTNAIACNPLIKWWSEHFRTMQSVRLSHGTTFDQLSTLHLLRLSGSGARNRHGETTEDVHLCPLHPQCVFVDLCL